MSFISYAQNYEDVLINRAFKDVSEGFYIDVGACDPLYDSISKSFYDRGWSGINVEPDTDWYEKIKAARDRDINLNFLVAKEKGEKTLFKVGRRGTSTTNQLIARKHVEGNEDLELTSEDVLSITLSDVFAHCDGREVHFLKIDVESDEAEILLSTNFSSIRPWLILIEAIDPITHDPTHEQWESHLLESGYKFVYFDGLNRFYLREDKTDLSRHFEAPVNVLDDFVQWISICDETDRQKVLERRAFRGLCRKVGAMAIVAAQSGRTLNELSVEVDKLNSSQNNSYLTLEKVANKLNSYDHNLDLFAKDFNENLIKMAKESSDKATEISDGLSMLVSDLRGVKDDVLGAVLGSEKEILTAVVELNRFNQDCLKNIEDNFDRELAVARKKESYYEGEIRRIRDLYDCELDSIREEVIATQQSYETQILNLKETTSVLSENLVKDRQQYEKGLNVLEREIDAIYQSRSWKVSYPLRIMSKLFFGDRVPPECKHRQVSKQEEADVIALDIVAEGVGQATELNSLKAGESSQAGFIKLIEQGVPLSIVYVDHSISYEFCTGVQRVVRGLSIGLFESGVLCLFVKRGEQDECVLISESERNALASNGGPQISAYDYPYTAMGGELIDQELIETALCASFICPEVPYISASGKDNTLAVIHWARRRKLPVGFIFYDAIPLRVPEYKHLEPAHSRYMRELLNADYVWPISQWSERDLISFWVNSELCDFSSMPLCRSISVVSDPVNSTVFPGISKNILSVGSISRHKNQLSLLQAFSKFLSVHRDWTLTLVGHLHADVADEVNELVNSHDGIKHVGYVSAIELENLYQQCHFTVFPSLEEGAGLPILESLKYRKPCVCANFGAMLEVANGGGCLTADMRAADEICTAMEKLATDFVLYSRLRQEAMDRHFDDWADYSKKIHNQISLQSRFQENFETVIFWVDATLEFEGNSGIQRVLRKLSMSLIDNGLRLVPVKLDGNEPVLASSNDLDLLSKWGGPDADKWYLPSISLSSCMENSLFMLPELPLNIPVDVRRKLFSRISEECKASVAIFFDAIPWSLSDIYPKEYGFAHSQYMDEVLEFDLILAISEFSAKELKRYAATRSSRYGSIEERVLHIDLAGDFSEPRGQPVRNESELVILSLGTIEPRKNQLKLLNAFSVAKRECKKPVRLILLGGNNSFDPDYLEQVKKLVEADPMVSWVLSPDDQEITRLIQKSDFTIYPSIEEGFGLPILESLHLGVPVICANFGAMGDIAQSGGCYTTDVRETSAIKKAIVTLANNEGLRRNLASESKARKYKTWRRYGAEIIDRCISQIPSRGGETNIAMKSLSSVGSKRRPKLSICITTYNRSAWLDRNLGNIYENCRSELDDVEVLVCDNCSTDDTQEKCQKHIEINDLCYFRNSNNVGMLGNLRQTVLNAQGDYIWVIGDDDLIIPGAIDRVKRAIVESGSTNLIYLNYSYTRHEEDSLKDGIDHIYRDAVPIAISDKPADGYLKNICAENENFFTAIYTLVFRRDHAFKAYSQDVSGPQFSSLLTSIPTSQYAIEKLMDKHAVWINEPCLVVNLNVSWLKFAPVWILEIIPLLMRKLEQSGVPPEKVDKWKEHHLPGIEHYLCEVLNRSDLSDFNLEVDLEKLFRNIRYLPKFEAYQDAFRAIYSRAYVNNHQLAQVSVSQLF